MKPIPQRLDSLSPAEKRTLLAQLLQEHAAKPGTYPMSFAQQRMWFLWQLDPQSSAYTIFTAVHSHDTIDVDIMKRTLTEIVRRHAVLRTTFALEQGQPVQIVAPPAPMTVPVIDLTAVSAALREAAVQRCLTDAISAPFDMARGPLFRAQLLWLGEHEHILVITLHHSIADGWSINILVREVLTIYAAFAAGKPTPLPELPIQYTDYAHWQRELLDGELGRQELGYWTQHLAGAPALLDLPTDRPRPAQQTFNGAHRSLVLPAALRTGLQAVSQQEGVTLFMTLLAAFKTLLWRYTGQMDILVGTPVANRHRVETEDLIGFFANTLVLRTDLAGNPSFRELLQRVRAVALGAYAHQQVPFEKIVDALQPERDLSHTPLFQVMFVLQSQQVLAAFPQETPFTLRHADNATAKFDLTVLIEESPQGLQVVFEYNTDLFDAATIQQMMRHFQRLLEGIVANPGQRLAMFPLLSPAEWNQVVTTRNACGTYDMHQSLPALFEAQVAAHGHAIALIHAEEYLTYAQLNTRANQLAHLLRRHGVGPEVIVGICLERSPILLIAVLAVLKAGGAYVPLDPRYPRERLRFMLTDARAQVLLTEEQHAATFDDQVARVIGLDAHGGKVAHESGDNLGSSITAENLAYVIYTSGSTGRPKGVGVTHANVTRLFAATDAWFHFSAADVWTLFHSAAFDFSVWEIWGALLYGGRLVSVPYLVSRAPDQLLALLERERVTILNQTPSAFRQLMQAEAARAQPADLALRTVIFGGEALTFASLHPWMARHGDVQPQLVNMYGITETTVHVTYRRLHAEDLHGTKGSMIGIPIPDLRVYLLDPYMQPVPVGVAGEIYVGGAGVARGYLHRPGLTAEHFVPDPFSTTPGARLYRSGDLARFRADGDLEYLGRMDQQIKIRGFRIEAGEIETWLSQHPAVREVVVVARADRAGGQYLVAYVVPERTQVPSVRELRNLLKINVPEHMLPARFVLLDTLPLTPHGKVDRCALPPPDQARPDLTAPFTPPGDSVEAILARIWAEVLGLERVGIHDNFFEVGGDSIISLQIIARANQVGIRLTPRHLFQHPTIAALATVAGTTPTIQAEQGSVIGAVPLTPIQHWFFAQHLPDPHHFNQAVMVELWQPLDPVYLQRACAALVQHHDALRLRFVQHADGWHQFNAADDHPVALTQVRLATTPDADAAAVMTQTTARLQASLNLEHGPLMQVILFDRQGDPPGYLVIIVHHLAIDHVSWQILLEDLHTAYQQIRQHEPVVLPPKTTSFKEWAERLKAYAQTTVLLHEYHYWQVALRRQVGRLPLDLPAPSGQNSEASTETLTVTLSAGETQALMQTVASAYNLRIDEMLLAAVAQTLASWTGSGLVLIDLEGHGRGGLFEDEVDLSRTVGWFTTMFPALIDLRNSSGPGALLKTVKEQLRRIPQQGVNYGLLRYVRSDPDLVEQLRQFPPAEISFNYLGQSAPDWPADAVFGPPREAPGPTRSPRGQRSHLLAINGFIATGQLVLHWTYSQHLHHRTTCEHLAQQVLAQVRLLVAHSQTPEAGGYTPSDFPLAAMDERKLEKIARLLETKTGNVKRPE